MVRSRKDVGPPSSIYVHVATDQVVGVQSVLAQTANPAAPY